MHQKLYSNASLLTIKQLPFWNSLLEENLSYLEEGYDYPVFAVDSVKALLEKIDSFYSGKTVWLVQYGAKIVGVFAIGNFPEPVTAEQNWYETVVYIHPEFRNLGIAKTLTLSAAQAFQYKPNSNLLVEVRSDNEGSIQAHAKIFPNIQPLLVEHTDFTAYQWRIEDQYQVVGANRWLSEEIGIGTNFIGRVQATDGSPTAS